MPGPAVNLGPSAPSNELLARFLHEKRGFLLLLSRSFQQSRENYLRALGATAGQTRGQIKVRLGLALVDYLEAIDADADATAHAVATQDLSQRAEEAGIRDLAAAATSNAALMSVRAVALEPYEIL